MYYTQYTQWLIIEWEPIILKWVGTNHSKTYITYIKHIVHKTCFDPSHFHKHAKTSFWLKTYKKHTTFWLGFWTFFSASTIATLHHNTIQRSIIAIMWAAQIRTRVYPVRVRCNSVHSGSIDLLPRSILSYWLHVMLNIYVVLIEWRTPVPLIWHGVTCLSSNRWTKGSLGGGTAIGVPVKGVSSKG